MQARLLSIQGLIVVLAVCVTGRATCAMDWLPISPEELKMTSEPKAPAAPAIYLYRQVDRDDDGPNEVNYVRIKILTEEGRKFADVEIPFEKSTEDVGGILGRTIHPDGSVVKFDGTTYDKTIIQSRGSKLLAKTFTMPDVEVGSIIEYRYKHDFRRGYVFNSQWILSQGLFTKYAKFSLSPYRGYSLSYSWPVGLPAGTNLPTSNRGIVRLEVHDVAAFVTEEYMPPANQLTFRVDFIYATDWTPEKDATVFWKKFGKKKYSEVEHFLDKRRVMTEAVAQIIGPGDSAETKLRKIYARTQSVRNITFERQKSDQEADREDLKGAKNVEDVWKRGYGDAEQITWLFVALVRAAGIQSDAVLVSARDTRFFNAAVMNPAELNTNVALITLDGKGIYLDPGMAFAPFGVLPWGETAIKGLQLTKDGGAWITTPLSAPAESRIERKAALELTPTGTLQGKVTVIYTGQEALWRRLEERHEDDTDRKAFLEDQIKRDIPSGILVELTNRPEWDNSSPTLVAEYDLQVPGWAATTGQRALLPAGLFGGREKHIFQHAMRTQPLYFDFPHQSADDISIKLPLNWQLGSIPRSRNDDRKGLIFTSSTEAKDGSLHFTRELSMNVMLLSNDYYPVLQDFFRKIRSGDEEQAIVLRPQNSAVH